MHSSIRFKLTSLLIVIVGFVILFTWTLNEVFSESYYIAQEKNSIVQNFEKIKNVISENSDSTEDGDYTLLKQQLEEISYGSNIRFMVSTENELSLSQTVIYSNINKDSKSFTESLYYLNLLRTQIQAHGDSSDENILPSVSMSETMNDLVNKGYMILEMNGKSTAQRGLYLFGFTDDGYLVGMSSSIESLRASAQISSRFLAYTGLIGIMFGSVLIFFFSLQFTKPIHDMAEVANRMSGLDFDAKVNVHSGDELEELGSSMNVMSEKLEKTIAELKTANLELKKDIARKDEVDEMRKEFISHVSHELKTPIALIQGYAEGLMDNVIEDDESKEFYCEVIVDEAQKMNKMVKNLLALNQLENGNTQINLQRFDIVSMMRNKINSTKILIDKKNNHVEFEYTEPFYVWADEYMIEEVFSNYLSNALNHVYENGLIRVWLEPKESEVRIHVYNDGDQIPEEELKKLWIKFYKVDKARTREYGGNGIGLSIVAAAMKAHGKQFGVQNCEHGVEFYFDLDTTNK